MKRIFTYCMPKFVKNTYWFICKNSKAQIGYLQIMHTFLLFQKSG